MFRKFRETQELKLANLRLQYLLLSKVYNFVEGFPDLLELAKKAKDLNTNEFQKEIVSVLVGYLKANEPTVAKDETVEE